MKQQFIDFLGSYNINLSDPNVPPLVLLCLCVLMMTFVGLLSFTNFLVYVIIIRVSETDLVLNFLSRQR